MDHDGFDEGAWGVEGPSGAEGVVGVAQAGPEVGVVKVLVGR